MDCIPPWLSSNKQCTKNIKIYNYTKEEIIAIINYGFRYPTYDSRPTRAEKMCKKPCRKMTNKVSLISDEHYNTSNSKFKLRFKKTVQIRKKVIVYTFFNFIIDVGSSLGLWLGLSALGITDLAIEAFMLAKTWVIANLNSYGGEQHRQK